MDIQFNARFGTISFEDIPGDPLHNYVVHRDENGIVTERRKEWSHYVCCGLYECFKCGRVLQERPKWWEFWK